jgi:hypothetical protein
MRVFTVVWGVWLLVLGVAMAQEPPPEADLAQAVRNLGDPSFQVRERAQERLKEWEKAWLRPDEPRCPRSTGPGWLPARPSCLLTSAFVSGKTGAETRRRDCIRPGGG